MRVGDLMSREVVALSPKDSLRDAYTKMLKNGFRHVVVLEGSKLVGILSDRDVMTRAVKDAKGLDVPAIPIAEVMAINLLTCRPEATVGKAAGIMVTAKIDALPVVDALGTLVGIVTSTDMLSYLAEHGNAPAKLLPVMSDQSVAAQETPMSWVRARISYLT